MLTDNHRSTDPPFLIWAAVRLLDAFLATGAAGLFTVIWLFFPIFGGLSEWNYAHRWLFQEKLVVQSLVIGGIWFLIFLGTIHVFPSVQREFETDKSARIPLWLIAMVIGFVVGNYLLNITGYIIGSLTPF